MNTIKIGLVDDHHAIALGVSSELSKTNGYEVLFVVSERNDIQHALSIHSPDILIMDVVMPGTISIDHFKDVLSNYQHQKIIAYTALNSPVIIELLFRVGVKGYVNKNQPLNDLVTAIQQVQNNKLYLPEEYSYLLKKIKSNEVPEQLSEREIEILRLITKEKKTPEIAELLHISVNTVETHRKHLFDKLHVSNLAGLIKAGFEMGYIT
jgi:DNA-binding NarL/FixJ family response regulator